MSIPSQDDKLLVIISSFNDMLHLPVKIHQDYLLEHHIALKNSLNFTSFRTFGQETPRAKERVQSWINTNRKIKNVFGSTPLDQKKHLKLQSSSIGGVCLFVVPFMEIFSWFLGLKPVNHYPLQCCSCPEHSSWRAWILENEFKYLDLGPADAQEEKMFLSHSFLFQKGPKRIHRYSAKISPKASSNAVVCYPLTLSIVPHAESHKRWRRAGCGGGGGTSLATLPSNSQRLAMTSLCDKGEKLVTRKSSTKNDWNQQ